MRAMSRSWKLLKTLQYDGAGKKNIGGRDRIEVSIALAIDVQVHWRVGGE